MSLLVGLLVALGVLLWPGHFGRRRMAILPTASSGSAPMARSVPGSHGRGARRWLPGHRSPRVSAQDLLGLLEAIAPALDAGMAPAAALRIAAEARSGPERTERLQRTGRAERLDPLAAMASDMASAAADGATLGPLWREAAESADSEELLLLAQAWSLTEDMGAPLAHAVRTTAGLLEARIVHERRLAAAVAGAKATVNVLTVLPLGGPLLALTLGIGPSELYGGSRLTQASLVLGLGLAGIGRWWVRRMVRAVARGPVIA